MSESSPVGIANTEELTAASRIAAEQAYFWRPAFAILAVSLAAFLALYWKTAASMAQTWRDSSYSHCFLIFPISLYLVWLQRGKLRRLTPRPNPWALVFLAALCFGWLLGALAEVVVVQRFAFIGMIVCLVWAQLGTEFVRAMKFPLAFLFFAVPFGDSVIPILQDYAAWFAVKTLDLIHIPVVLEGRVISVSSGTWEVADTCSGLRFLISSLAVGFLYAGIGFRTWGRRILFFVISAIVPVVANGIRVFGIVFVSEYSGNAAAVYADHVFYGWLFFSMVTFVLLGIGWTLREKNPTEPATSAGSHSDLASGANSRGQAARTSGSLKLIALIGLAALIVVASSPLALAHLNQATPDQTYARLPTVTAPWTLTNRIAPDWTPRFVGTSSELQKVYIAGSRRVTLYIAFYSAAAGAKLAGSQNVLYLKPRWTRVSEAAPRSVVDGHPVVVHQTIIKSEQSAYLIWSWYWVDGEHTQNAYRAKFLLARSRLLGSRQGSAAIAVASEFTRDPSEAASALQDFLTHTTLFADNRR